MYSQLENYAINIRKSIIEMITNSKSGHPGGSLSSVEILQGINLSIYIIS